MPRALRKELTLVGSFVGFLVVFSAISGCVSTGDIAPEAATLDANALATDHAIQAAAREAGWPQAQWWKVYADPQLDAWIEKALDGNPGLAVAHARVRQAKSHGRAGGVHRVAADRGQGLASPPPLAGRLFLRPRRPGADHFLEQLHRDRPELQARSLGARPQRQRARRRPGPHGRRRGAPGAARAGGQHRPRLRPALVAVRRDGHRQGHAATAARHPRPGPASPARRHRHAFRGQPGGSAAARDRAPHRGDRRRNPAHPQPARRPGRQGPGRGPHDPPAKPEPGGAAEPAQRLAGRTARSPPGCGRPPLAGRRPGQGRGRGARRLLPQRRPDGLGRLQCRRRRQCWSSSAAPSTPTAPARR
ncbi:putative outer membrane protein [Pseudomonas aeruginosa]|nr:putative outer membrane protein [Pseudomonas aeruginosa]